jgi:hypothetical protein
VDLHERFCCARRLERVEELDSRLDLALLADVAELDQAEDHTDDDCERLDALEDQLPVGHCTTGSPTQLPCAPVNTFWVAAR